MERWIKVPFLPQTNVSLMLCQRENRLQHALEQRGIQTIPVSACAGVTGPIQCHADTQAIPLGGSALLVASNAPLHFKDILRAAGAKLYESFYPVKGKYPNDVRLNFAVLGNWIIGKTQVMDPVLSHFCDKNQWLPVHVRQGYGKCSVGILSKSCMITSDSGIADKCQRLGLDVLKIQAGHIQLSGYDTGLIGGTCGKLSHDQLAFCGNILTHPDGKRMVGFLEQHGIEPVCLWDGPLMDAGSLIPLKEYVKTRDLT